VQCGAFDERNDSPSYRALEGEFASVHVCLLVDSLVSHLIAGRIVLTCASQRPCNGH